MIDLANCIAIGTIIKTHGIKGQVVLRLIHFKLDEIKSFEPVYLEIDGLPVPFFIVDYFPKDQNTVILGFEDFTTNEDLEELMDAKVYIPLKNLRSEAKITDTFKSLSGYEVRDSIHGKLGLIAEIIESDHNPLLRVVDKKREVLIPLQPAFINDIDHSKKIVSVQVPDGLLDL
jgi:16S rRNA processing protein RimM